MFSELIDVKEENLFTIDVELLKILLLDKSSKKNIIWATDIYTKYGYGYNTNDQITVEKVTGIMKNVIKPRVKKNKEEKSIRIKDKAEVFTPSWMCNLQNNIIDEKWFGYENVFNKNLNNGWQTKKKKIKFINQKKWDEYILERRLEVSCGEAPYLVSRYDTVTGEIIPVEDRIGMLDRKLRIINENIDDEILWSEWVVKAFKNIYGYELQGDSLLIARENLLYTFTDNFKYKFNKKPKLEIVKEIAEIVSWNIFQMDATKFVVPYSCKNERIVDYTLFGEEVTEQECHGCKKGSVQKHNGIYVRVMNWETKRPLKFVSILNRSDKNE